jgi:nitrogen regulatory protein P-II 2
LVDSMKYLSTMIRLKRLDSVKRELQRIEINRLIISSVSGYGVQGGHLETKAMNYEAKLPKKIKIEIAVNDDFLQTTVEAIQRGSRNKDGYVGSGKIFVLPLENVIKIRTNETGHDAI